MSSGSSSSVSKYSGDAASNALLSSTVAGIKRYSSGFSRPLNRRSTNSRFTH